MAAVEATPPPKPKQRRGSKVLRIFKRDAQDEDRVFGIPLDTSMNYAGTTAILVRDGKRVPLQVPIIVAECGRHIKEHGIASEGIFRVSGSSERIQALQGIFDQPPDYGYRLDWTPYTIYDAADVLRRYLAQLPEPVVPFAFYDGFLAPLQRYREQLAAGGGGTTAAVAAMPGENDTAAAFRRLVSDMPAENHHVIIYLLDLLAFFAKQAGETRMGAKALAVIFQPELLSKPLENMTIADHKESQEILEYLIEMGDTFALDEVRG